MNEPINDSGYEPMQNPINNPEQDPMQNPMNDPGHGPMRGPMNDPINNPDHGPMRKPSYPVSDNSPGMESASLILGMLSLFLMVSGFSFIVGSIGAILALLSRGSGEMSRKAKSGLITSSIGIVGGIFITVSAFMMIYTGDMEGTLKNINELYETYITEGQLNPEDVDRFLSRDNQQTVPPDSTVPSGNTASLENTVPGEVTLPPENRSLIEDTASIENTDLTKAAALVITEIQGGDYNA